MDSNSVAAFYEDFSIYWYGITMGLALFAGLFLSCAMRLIQRQRLSDVLRPAIPAIPLGLIGAKAFYCWHGPEAALNFGSLFKVSKYLEGGMALFGALGGGLAAVLIYCLIHKVNIPELFDCLTPGLALGIGIGRLASGFSTSDRGTAVESAALQKAPFATWNEADGEWLLNVYFFEALAAFITFAVLLAMFIRRYKTEKSGFGTGDVTLAFMIMFGMSQCWLEPLRSDALYWNSNIIVRLYSVPIGKALSALIAAVALSILILRYAYNYGIELYSVFTVVACGVCFVCLFTEELRVPGADEAITTAMKGESALVLIVMGIWLIYRLDRFKGRPKLEALIKRNNKTSLHQ